MTQPTFTVNIYEKENGKYWPAGQYTFDTRKRAIRCLEYQVCDGICGLVRSGDAVYAYAGMSAAEAIKRIAGVYRLATIADKREDSHV